MIFNQSASYYGSCAGAIACSTRVDQHGPMRIFRRDYSDLTGMRFNTALTSAPYLTQCDNGEAWTRIKVEVMPEASNNNRICRLFHANGPVFTEVPANYDILATYKTPGNIQVPNSSAAAIVNSISDSHHSPSFLFTGVHPEVGIEDLEQSKMKTMVKRHVANSLEKDLKILAESDRVRHAVFRQFLEAIHIQLK